MATDEIFRPETLYDLLDDSIAGAGPTPKNEISRIDRCRCRHRGISAAVGVRRTREPDHVAETFVGDASMSTGTIDVLAVVVADLLVAKLQMPTGAFKHLSIGKRKANGKWHVEVRRGACRNTVVQTRCLTPI
ncbi:unnamed protein product [Phytophthora lilii]|uniref:Unnamed protein product n=1 Tax=Phytophthora lilii TaxID=2077276 RepID=A0A9W6TST5_9STRA|nr:unnamed protein product [Phytophthora lilii]